MYVCICKAVTETQIEAAVRDGAASLRDLRDRLGVASQCGRCACDARRCLREARADLAAEEAFGQPDGSCAA